MLSSQIGVFQISHPNNVEFLQPSVFSLAEISSRIVGLYEGVYDFFIRVGILASYIHICGK